MKTRLKSLLSPVSELVDWYRLPAAARAEHHADLRGLPEGLAPPGDVVAAAMDWLCRAQDFSASGDGGVARHFSLVSGWGTSYPETTGYIVPTFISYGGTDGNGEYGARARRMLDWLVAIQLPDGGFQGGRIDSTPVVPVTFNTGQILIGLAAGVEAFGDVYREPMRRAAQWLVDSQDADGCWRRNPTPFAAPGEKAYETHVSWGLFEAARQDEGRGYGEAGLRNVHWALTKQRSNGWFADCCLSDPTQPLTHTLGYVLRGVLEAHRYSGDPDLLEAAVRTADGLASGLREDGFLPGRFDHEWRPRASWACLTGSVQIAHCWLMLHELTHRADYLDAARRANRFVRRTIALEGPDGVRGGVKGSFPVSGEYGRFEYLNWAAKFFVDSHLLEERVAG